MNEQLPIEIFTIFIANFSQPRDRLVVLGIFLVNFGL